LNYLDIGAVGKFESIRFNRRGPRRKNADLSAYRQGTAEFMGLTICDSLVLEYYSSLRFSAVKKDYLGIFYHDLVSKKSGKIDTFEENLKWKRYR
jgi:hypothetical protein